MYPAQFLAGHVISCFFPPTTLRGMYICTYYYFYYYFIDAKLGLGEIKPHGKKARCYVT